MAKEKKVKKMKRIICLVIIALEGSALLSFEIIASRLYTPHLGSSIYVWTSILSMTLIALALGYYYGGKIIREKIPSFLRISLMAGSILIFISPYTAKFILPATDQLSIELASLISGAVIIIPPIFLLGLVSPMISHFISSDYGKNSGLVYGTGTLFGVISTIGFVHFILPSFGVHNSVLIIASLVCAAFLLTFLIPQSES